MKNIDITGIIEEAIKKSVKQAIMENATEEVYIIKNKEGEPIEMFETEEEAQNALDVYTKDHPDKEFIIEKGTKPSFDELDSMSEKIDNMENINEIKHKGHFTSKQVMQLAEAAGKTTTGAKSDLEELCEAYGTKIPASNVFEILDDHEMSDLKSKIKVKENLTGNQDKLDVDHDGEIEASDLAALRAGEHAEEEECYECGQSMEEDMPVTISGAKPNDLDEESHVCEKCGKEVCECGGGMYESKKTVRLSESQLIELIGKMVSESVPGLSVYEKAHKESGSQNKSAIDDMAKEIKDYLSFDGNDNPEFPGHNEGDVEARQSKGEEADEIADNRGGGLEDLNYDVEPSDKFKDRLEMSLKGDSKMGNGQKDAGNVIPSKLGDNMIKKVKRKKEAQDEAPMYEKDPAPVKNLHESVISEEIKRMKEMVSYNKKTQ